MTEYPKPPDTELISILEIDRLREEAEQYYNQIPDFQTLLREYFINYFTQTNDLATQIVRLLKPKNHFDHLIPYGNPEGPRSARDLVDSMAQAHEQTGRKQVLTINGNLGAGKTTTAEAILKILKGNFKGKKRVVYISAEKALEASRALVSQARDIRSLPIELHGVNPTHISGSYTQEDYIGGSYILGQAIAHALHDRTIAFIVVEAPLVGGIIDSQGERIGMDRGTSALVPLFQHNGVFSNFTYDIGVIGLVAGGHKQINTFSQRKDRDEARLFNDSAQEYPGGTMRGTLLADWSTNQLLVDLIQRTYIDPFPQVFAALGIKATDVFNNPKVFFEYGVRALVMGLYYYPWLYFTYVGQDEHGEPLIPKQRVFIGENAQRSIRFQTVSVKELDYIDYLLRTALEEELLQVNLK